MLRFRPHLLLFTFGFIYYFISPVIIGSFDFFNDILGFNNWHSDYESLHSYKLNQYMLIITFWYFLFMIPSFFIRYNKKISDNNKTLRISKISLLLILSPIFIYAALRLPTMIGGYSTDEITGKGTIATGSMFMLYVNIYLIQNRDSKGFLNGTIKWMLYFVTFCLLLSGTRMYFLIVVLAFLINYFFFENKVRIPFKFYAISFSLFIFIVAFGVLRNGFHNSVTMDALLSVFFMEPLFTWWSAMTYLELNEIPAISTPSGFFSSFLNFLPSFIFPDKASILVPTKNLAKFYSPLGAESLFVAVSANFGYVFGGIYFMFLGGYFTLMHVMSKSNIYVRTHYICICAILPFQFYRDGFDIINKQVFFNLLIIPILIILVSRLVKIHGK